MIKFSETSTSPDSRYFANFNVSLLVSAFVLLENVLSCLFTGVMFYRTMKFHGLATKTEYAQNISIIVATL